jgi:hypothetical protein
MPVFGSYRLNPKAPFAVDGLGFLDFGDAAGNIIRIPSAPLFPVRVI